jgi:branched-subunit amino acid transport protein AzlD
MRLRGDDNVWSFSDMKIIIVILLIAIIVSLARALYYLIKKPESSAEMVKALTWRISLSIALFCLVLLAFALGWIQPHGILNRL